MYIVLNTTQFAKGSLKPLVICFRGFPCDAQAAKEYM